MLMTPMPCAKKSVKGATWEAFSTASAAAIMSPPCSPWPAPRERRLLHGLDLGQQVLQLGVRLAEHAHAAEVADITVKIAA